MKKKKLIMLSMIICLAVIIFFSGNSIFTNSYDISTPKSIVKSYFIALNKNDYNFIRAITDSNSYVSKGSTSIKTVILFHIREDKKNAENFIKYGMGMTNSYYDVVSFKVTYYIKHKKGEDPLQTDGINSKWITLTKDKEDSDWKVREMGEG